MYLSVCFHIVVQIMFVYWIREELLSSFHCLAVWRKWAYSSSMKLLEQLCVTALWWVTCCMELFRCHMGWWSYRFHHFVLSLRDEWHWRCIQNQTYFWSVLGVTQTLHRVAHIPCTDISLYEFIVHHKNKFASVCRCVYAIGLTLAKPFDPTSNTGSSLG